MSAEGDLLAELADVARAKGLTSLRWSAGETDVEFTVGPLPVPAPTQQTLLPLSRPTDDPQLGAERADRARRVAEYRDALEGAHVTGHYPVPQDYGLGPGDVT